MKSQTNPQFSPRKQNDTPLSEQRRKFFAKQRAENDRDLQQQISGSPVGEYEAIDRIHRHDRKNLSGKVTAVRPRRTSKHDVGKKSSSCSTQRRTSCAVRRSSGKLQCQGSRRTSFVLTDLNQDLDFLNTSASSLNFNGGAGRLGRRKRRTRSIVATKVIPTPQNSLRSMRRRSALVTVNMPKLPEPEHNVISALNHKFGLDW